MATTTRKRGRPRKVEIIELGVEGDLDGDGIVTEDEVKLSNLMVKHAAQTRLSYMAMFSMMVVTALLFLPIFPDTRINALGDLITLFYISNASIVGTYMGVTAYMSTKTPIASKK